jgi:hypothetical protein
MHGIGLAVPLHLRDHGAVAAVLEVSELGVLKR